jgi:histidinol dehydrogenase
MRVHRLASDGAGAELATSIRALAPPAADVAAEVAETLERVRRGGDEALLELSERFDGVRPAALRVGTAELEAASERVDREVLDALELAAENVRAVAEAQPAGEPVRVELAQGQAVSLRSVPVGSAGIYVPGGRAAYPSSAVMGAVPALVAGVERVAVVTPPGADGRVDALVLAACAVVGVGEVYALGGIQAIAALAYGTESVEAVDAIAGPGGARVQEAKLQVSRQVGIDGYAGPSELMVVLDSTAPLDWLALDLCAQAEHGGDGLLVAASADPALLDALGERVLSFAAGRASVAAEAPLALVSTESLGAALTLAEEIAPEHLQLACEGAERLAGSVRTAGCVFTGPIAATAFGDYAAGSDHILPTGGAGRFTGPLGPGAFRRLISVVELPLDAAGALAPAVDVLAREEGFPVHGESALARAGRPGAADAPAKMEER